MLKPLGKNVVIRTDDVGNTTESGIILTGQRPNLPTDNGTVMSVGPDCVDLKCGDRVMYSRLHSQSIEIEGMTSSVLIPELEVMMLLESTNK